MTPVAATQAWLDKAVIGLNLCPFAKAVHGKGLIRWVESPARDTATLLAGLTAEMQLLAAADPQAIDTTLLIAPLVLADFIDFNEFLALADAALDRLGLAGTLQVASFHPRYQFAGTRPGDITNCTNRSPHPTLHLLREASVDRAVAAYPDAQAIFGRNMATLRKLGHAGWKRLMAT